MNANLISEIRPLKKKTGKKFISSVHPVFDFGVQSLRKEDRFHFKIIFIKRFSTILHG